MCVCECILVLKKTYLSNISVHKQLFCILSTVSCIKRRKTLFITLKIYCQCYFFKKYIHYTFILKIPVNNRNHVKRGFCEGRPTTAIFRPSHILPLLFVRTTSKFLSFPQRCLFVKHCSWSIIIFFKNSKIVLGKFSVFSLTSLDFQKIMWLGQDIVVVGLPSLGLL